MTSEAISRRVTPELGVAAFERWWASLDLRNLFKERHNLFFLLFASSAVLSSYGRNIGADSSSLAAIAALLGSATCGWAWLFMRSLFVPTNEDTSVPVMAVLLILMLQFADAAGAALGGGGADLLSVATEIVAMVGSTFVIVTLAEVARHIPGTPQGPERRFRQVLSGGYLALLIVAVFMVGGASEGSFLSLHASTIESAAALTAMVGGAMALTFRHQHPLTQSADREQARASSEPPTASDEALAGRVEELMRMPETYTRPSLKVADVAAQLGTHDYLVSKVISKVLREPNFNRYVNRLRIEHAKEMLRDPELSKTSILVIALDCGFASIGPFNRAFREETGMTPSAFRRMNVCSG
jgi:AraC-like DNA-binding protein